MSTEIEVRGMSRGNRQIAAAIAAAGDQVVSIRGSQISRRDAVAHLVWHALLDGEIIFTDGRIMSLDDMDQWMALLRWVGAHIDGPPVTLADSKALNAVVRVVYDDQPAYPPGAEPVSDSAVYQNGA